MKHYLSITIGPIFKTITQARATREIWASSFVFSLLMKKILLVLKEHPKKADILNPTLESLKDNGKYYGAGIYPDRCHVALNDKLTDEELEELRNEALKALPFWKLDEKKKYFQIYAVQTELDDSSGISVLKHLNKIMDSVELQQKFLQEGEQDIISALEKNIQKLYKEGMSSSEDDIFLVDKGERRLPSLLEICNREHKDLPKFKEKVTNVIWESLRRSKKKEEYWDETDTEILKVIKKEVAGDQFKFRNKYFAIVQADGDGIGTRIQGLGNDAEAIKEFSKKLFDFSKEAAKEIHKFGALPVYIGGDDLLFVSPLVNEKQETIFDLLNSLDKSFKCEMGKDNGMSMSYGISIGYYKYPMGDVLRNAHDLLTGSAKKLEIGERKKNAVAFQVRKHSGQNFGCILPKGPGAYEFFGKMLKQHHNNLKESFLSSLIYTLTEHRFLLWKALEAKTEKFFFKNHFNEKVHQNNLFLKSVEEFVRKIYDDMQDVSLNSGWQRFDGFDGNQQAFSIVLYSCLRLIQFLNAEDHD